MSNSQTILNKITEYYLSSRDFNGLPIRDLIQRKLDQSKLKDMLISLIQGDKISLNFGDIHPNPYVKALKEENSETQIDKLIRSDITHVCAYPTYSHLKEVVDTRNYEGEPFTLRLALGEPQLSYESFDLSVLEFYRNDPRYYYRSNDISGSIGVRDRYYESSEMPTSDQVLLQTFGFSYDSQMNRAVAVYLRYLSTLSPEHQQIWNAKIVKGDFKLHPDYFRPSILGEFPEGISVFNAFLEEQNLINEICKLMQRPPLFRNIFKNEEKPKEFCFLIRPTSKEYNNFIHLLDKVISENINKDFFLDDVQSEYYEQSKEGKRIVRYKGTIQMLDEWLNLYFTTDDRKPIEEMISTFKEIRKIRQYPAHAIDDNIFDQEYFKLQREIIIKAYNAIRILLRIFALHPSAKQFNIPDYLESGTIWTY